LPLNAEKNEDEDKKWIKVEINKVMDEYKPGVFPLKCNGIFTAHCRCMCSEQRFSYRIFLPLQIITVL